MERGGARRFGQGRGTVQAGSHLAGGHDWRGFVGRHRKFSVIWAPGAANAPVLIPPWTETRSKSRTVVRTRARAASALVIPHRTPSPFARASVALRPHP